MTEPPGLRTVEWIAERFQVSPKTVRRAIDRGELEAYQLGERGATRATDTAILAWLQSRRVRPREPAGDTPAPDLTVPQPSGRRGRLALTPEMGRKDAAA